jgi:hypothetical protein
MTPRARLPIDNDPSSVALAPRLTQSVALVFSMVATRREKPLAYRCKTACTEARLAPFGSFDINSEVTF